jgi:hypothetical protein
MMILLSFFLLALLKESIQSFHLYYRSPGLPHPSCRSLLSLNEEVERILIELGNGNVPFL